MKKGLLIALMLVCCLGLSGCNDEERVRQALIDMGYMPAQEMTLVEDAEEELVPSEEEGDSEEGIPEVIEEPEPSEDVKEPEPVEDEVEPEAEIEKDAVEPEAEIAKDAVEPEVMQEAVEPSYIEDAAKPEPPKEEPKPVKEEKVLTSTPETNIMEP